MQPHEIITLYAIKPLEYAVAVLYLALFAGFWRYVNGEVSLSFGRVGAWAARATDLFRVPEHVFFHPGHAWARADTNNVITVGLDDFAQHLVGPVTTIGLPAVGSALSVGSRAWSVQAGEKSVDMLAPVTGTVVAVNDALGPTPQLVNEDPYGRGWLAKVRVAAPAKVLRSLKSGASARTWLDHVMTDLTTSASPDLGAVCQDGGLPVDGFAHAIDAEHWDVVARRFLLS